MVSFEPKDQRFDKSGKKNNKEQSKKTKERKDSERYTYSPAFVALSVPCRKTAVSSVHGKATAA